MAGIQLHERAVPCSRPDCSSVGNLGMRRVGRLKTTEPTGKKTVHVRGKASQFYRVYRRDSENKNKNKNEQPRSCDSPCRCHSVHPRPAKVTYFHDRLKPTGNAWGTRAEHPQHCHSARRPAGSLCVPADRVRLCWTISVQSPGQSGATASKLDYHFQQLTNT